MRYDTFLDAETGDDIVPGVVVDMEDSLLFLDVLFSLLFCCAGDYCICVIEKSCKDVLVLYES